jgi:hypothetical protein
MRHEAVHHPLLFAEMAPEGRVIVIDNVLADLTPDEARTLVLNPAILGLVSEAHLAGRCDSLESLADMAELLLDDDFRDLAALADEALLARLPSYG